MGIEFGKITVKSYEVLPKDSRIVFETSSPLIYYSTFLARSHLLVPLLVGLEGEGITTHQDIVLEKKGVKVKYDGWVHNEQEETLEQLEGVTTASSVHAVVKINISNREQAKRAADYLLENSQKTAPWQTKDGRSIADIRATTVLENDLASLGFKKVLANVQQVRTQQLMTFSPYPFQALGFHAVPILMNPQLVDFLELSK